jgi:hypothetical protein
MKTRVVNLRQEPCDVYIGRPGKWGNPFKISSARNREEVIRLFEVYLNSHPTLKKDLQELRGKTLGCWCYPQACHGDVLVKYLEITE